MGIRAVLKQFRSGLLLLGGFLSLGLMGSCNHLFYYPDNRLYALPGAIGVEYDEINFLSGDGTKLHAWHLKPKSNVPSKGLIAFAHGNAQNLSSHFLHLAWVTIHGYEVLIFDYRGYGQSNGIPNPQGTVNDTKSAFDLSYKLFLSGNHVTAPVGAVPKRQFIIYGQSLGGAITLRALQDFTSLNAVSLLVLDSTFRSYQRIAFDKLVSHPVTFLISPLAFLLVSDQEAAPKEFLANLTVPILVMHGTNDEVVPAKFGKQIFQDLNSPHKWFWEIEKGLHTDVFAAHDQKYQKQFIQFLQKLK